MITIRKYVTINEDVWALYFHFNTDLLLRLREGFFLLYLFPLFMLSIGSLCHSPGRASASPVLDLFITLLSMGVQGYTSLMTQRSQHMDYLHTKLGELASTFDLQLLQTKNNPISIGEQGQNNLKFLVLLLCEYIPCVFLHLCIVLCHASLQDWPFLKVLGQN